jgi:hypothetical protein
VKEPDKDVPDPHLELLTGIIAEEIAARIAVNDKDVDDREWPRNVAELVADAILWRFEVRERPPDEHPYGRE